MEENLIYNFIMDNDLVTQEALDLATACGGYNVETLNYIIYYCTAYHDIKQVWDCERDNYYFNDEIIGYYNLD